MPQLYSYRLFISHAWRYHESYKRLLRFLNEAPNFCFRNYSVPHDDAFGRMANYQLKGQLQEQIRPVSCVVVLGGLYVSHSDWIQFEIDYANSLDKPIIGIRPWGAERMPAAVTVAASEVVGWNASTIVRAIRERSL